MQQLHLILLFVFVLAIIWVYPGVAQYGFVAAAALALVALFAKSKRNPVEQYKEDPTTKEDAFGELDESAKPVDVYEPRTIDSMPAARPPADEPNPYPWMSNPKYTACYTPPPMDFNGCNLGSYLTLDEANAKLAAMRSRDKRSLDGAVTKNADYFRKNFGRELDRAENERWWGNNEY